MRWGIIGCGNIAAKLARGIARAEGAELAAVASRSTERAAAFAREHGAGHAHRGYPALLADDRVEIVYVATPHPQHEPWTIAAARAGKHVLCEKPLTVNTAGAERVVAAVREAGVFCYENYMYRLHPQTKRVVERLREGALGEVRWMRAAFTFAKPFAPEDRLFGADTAGGAILDIGCYPVSLTRHLAGAAAGVACVEPEAVRGCARFASNGVDLAAGAVARFPGQLLAEWTTAIDAAQRANDCVLVGDEGSLRIAWPWNPTRGGDAATVTLRRGEEEIVERFADVDLHAHTVASIERHVAAGRTEAPEMSLDDSLANMRALDAWRDAVGLVYPRENDPDWGREGT